MLSFKFQVVLVGLLVAPSFAQYQEATVTRGQLRLSEILIRTPEPYKTQQVEKAKQRADALLKALLNGSDFADLAKAKSDGPTAYLGGDVGYFSRADLAPSIAEVVFQMKAGDVTDVIRTKQGFAIFKVTDVVEAKNAPATPDISPDETWDFKTWIAIGAAFGTLVTALINLVRWWRERSLSHTIHEQSSQISGLFQLLNMLPSASAVSVDTVLANDLAAKVRQGLAELMGSLSATFDRASKLRMRPSAEMSFFRRWFLLFRPRGFRAGFAHFVFYSWLVPLFYSILALAFDRSTTFRLKLNTVLLFLVVSLASRYWAIVELRWLNPSQPEPSTLARVFLSYTPLTIGELMARTCLLVAVWNLFTDVFFQLYVLPVAVQTFSKYIESPGRLTALISNLGLILSVLICYFWDRAEYRLHHYSAPRPRFPHNLRFLYTPRTLEGCCCQLAFYAMMALFVREGWMFAGGLRNMARLLADPAANIPNEARSLIAFTSPPFMVFWSGIRTALPLYGAYRWGLAEYRARAHVPTKPQVPNALSDPALGAQSS